MYKWPRNNKFQSLFDPKPYIVSNESIGSMIIAKRSDHQLCRDISMFKKVSCVFKVNMINPFLRPRKPKIKPNLTIQTTTVAATETPPISKSPTTNVKLNSVLTKSDQELTKLITPTSTTPKFNAEFFMITAEQSVLSNEDILSATKLRMEKMKASKRTDPNRANIEMRLEQTDTKNQIKSEIKISVTSPSPNKENSMLNESKNEPTIEQQTQNNMDQQQFDQIQLDQLLFSANTNQTIISKETIEENQAKIETTEPTTGSKTTETTESETTESESETNDHTPKSKTPKRDKTPPTISPATKLSAQQARLVSEANRFINQGSSSKKDDNPSFK